MATKLVVRRATNSENLFARLKSWSRTWSCDRQGKPCVYVWCVHPSYMSILEHGLSGYIQFRHTYLEAL